MTALDLDTKQEGTDGPFEVWEGDHTAFAHVLWAARRNGLTLENDTDEIVSMLLRSRALAAHTAQAIARHERESFAEKARGAATALIAEAEQYEREVQLADRRLAEGGHPAETASGLVLRAKRYGRLAKSARARAQRILDRLTT